MKFRLIDGEKMPEKVIDADGAVLGRLASEVAKELLMGQKIIIVNAERAVISGEPSRTFKRFLEKRQRGSHKGPFYPKQPDRLLRRVVRGMLPYKKQRGRDALKNLKVVIGNPGCSAEKIGKSARELTHKYLTLAELCAKLGAKI